MQSKIPLRALLFIHPLFLFSSYNLELNTCDRNLLAHEAVNIYSLVLTDPCFRVLLSMVNVTFDYVRLVLQLTPAVDVSSCRSWSTVIGPRIRYCQQVLFQTMCTDLIRQNWWPHIQASVESKE